jgi:hypothetical protein
VPDASLLFRLLLWLLWWLWLYVASGTKLRDAVAWGGVAAVVVVVVVVRAFEAPVATAADADKARADDPNPDAGSAARCSPPAAAGEDRGDGVRVFIPPPPPPPPAAPPPLDGLLAPSAPGG